MLGAPCLKYWRCVLFLQVLKYICLQTKQHTDNLPIIKMLIFLFVEAREGPGELRGLYEREVAMAVGKLLEENSFEQ